MRRAFLVSIIFSFAIVEGLHADPTRHAIGIANGGDGFLVANVSALSGATIFAGDSVQAGNMSCELRMTNGSHIKLAPHATAQLYENRVYLQRGMAEATFGTNTKIEAQGFSVKPLSDKTQADVQVSSGSMTIALLTGQAEVSNLHGAVISRMITGSSLNFANTAAAIQAGPDAASSTTQIRLLGVLDIQDKHYLVRDRFTNTVTELEGDIPENLLHELTMIDGTLVSRTSDLPHVDRVVHISDIRRSNVAAGLPCVADGTGSTMKRITLKGPLSKNGDRYLISDSQKGTYEVVGDVNQSQVGTQVSLIGFVLSDRKGSATEDKVVYAERRKLVASESPCVGVISAGVIITTEILATRDWGGSSLRKPVSF